MLSKRIFLSLFALSVFSITGCQELHQGARDVGRPVGAVGRVPQAITEGIAEGYVGDSNTHNPYGR